MNTLKTKSVELGSAIISYCKELKEMDHQEISELLFESGTSVGCRVYGLDTSLTRSEFIQNLELTKSEASRTFFLLEMVEGIDELPVKSELKDLVGEIIRLLTASIKTAKSKAREFEN